MVSLDESENLSSDETWADSGSTFKTHDGSALIQTNNPPSVGIVNKKTPPAGVSLPITSCPIKPFVCQGIVDDTIDSFLKHGGSNCLQTSVMKTKVVKATNDEDGDGDEGMPEGEIDAEYTEKKYFISKKGKNFGKDSGTSKTGLSDLPPGNLDDRANDAIHSESLCHCLEASSRTIECSAKSTPASAPHSVAPACRDRANCVPSAQVFRAEILKGEPPLMPKVTESFEDTPAQNKVLFVQPNSFLVRRKPIADLADSDCSDHSLPFVTPKISSVRKRKVKTTQKKSTLINQTSKLVNADTGNQTSLEAGDNGFMNTFSSKKKKESQYASPELRIAAKKEARLLTKDRDESQANPSFGFSPKSPWSYSSDSDEVSNYINNWRKTPADVMTSDKIHNCDADSDTLGNNCHLNDISTKKDQENQCASPELRTDTRKWDGAFTTKKLEGKGNCQYTLNQKMLQTKSSDADEVSNYMKKWRKASKDLMNSDESDSCTADSDSSFIVDTCDEDEDDLSFYLPFLTKTQVQGEKKNSFHRDFGSISEELPNYNNPKLANTLPRTKKPHELSDSTNAAFLSEHVTFSRPRTQDVCLSDSDDDTSTTPSQIKPCNVKGLITPFPENTHKQVPRNTNVCPQTVDTSKYRVPSKATCKTSTMNCATPTLSFLASLSAQPGSDRLHPEAMPYLKSFKKNRQNLVDRLYKLFNSQCFDNELPADMSITWNVRLTKTAGYCYFQGDLSKPNSRGARVELSTKVVDNCERARDTLIHELCHAVSWIVSGYEGGHGAVFKSWGWRAVKQFPELPAISRCHNYKISCKYTYRCTKCNRSIGRHSKSLDISRKVCGHCRGRFELLVNGKSARQGAEGVPSTPRTPAPFALFVKENYGSVKKSASALKHADVMKILGEQFKEMKT